MLRQFVPLSALWRRGAETGIMPTTFEMGAPPSAFQKLTDKHPGYLTFEYVRTLLPLPCPALTAQQIFLRPQRVPSSPSAPSWSHLSLDVYCTLRLSHSAFEYDSSNCCAFWHQLAHVCVLLPYLAVASSKRAVCKLLLSVQGDGCELFIRELEDHKLSMTEIFIQDDANPDNIRPTVKGEVDPEPAWFQNVPVEDFVTSDWAFNEKGAAWVR